MVHVKTQLTHTTLGDDLKQEAQLDGKTGDWVAEIRNSTKEVLDSTKEVLDSTEEFKEHLDKTLREMERKCILVVGVMVPIITATVTTILLRFLSYLR